MIKRKFFPVLFTLGIAFVFSSTVYASAWVGCQVEALVIEEPKGGALVVRIVSVTDMQSGFGACPLAVDGKSLTIRPSTFIHSEDIAAGDIVDLEYTEGSAMTPNGAISYETWNVLGVRK